MYYSSFFGLSYESKSTLMWNKEVTNYNKHTKRLFDTKFVKKTFNSSFLMVVILAACISFSTEIICQESV
jgi:hypothetical protein